MANPIDTRRYRRHWRRPWRCFKARRGTPRRYKDRAGSALMGGVWRAMRIAMISPPMPDCRGGVFAVFAKIPPPILPTIRGYGGDAVV